MKPVNNTQAYRPRTSRPGRAKQRSQPQGRLAQRWKMRREGRETMAVVAASQYRSKAGERRPPEPGSREGSCPSDGMELGHRPGYTETRMPVNGPTPARPRSSAAITGRTVCGKSARTGLWGRRRVTSGATRRGEGGGVPEPPALMSNGAEPANQHLADACTHQLGAEPAAEAPCARSSDWSNATPFA